MLAQPIDLTSAERRFGSVAGWIKLKCSYAGDGCWRWTGGLDGSGYGRWSIDGKYRSMHRVAWTAFRGPIPVGLHVLHKCDVRNCLNPDHLFLGTNLDNTYDMHRKGRANVFGRKQPPRDYRNMESDQ